MSNKFNLTCSGESLLGASVVDFRQTLGPVVSSRALMDVYAVRNHLVVQTLTGVWDKVFDELKEFK